MPVYRVHYREDRDLSREALERLDRALGRANDLRRERLLLERGFPARPSELGAIETKDLASDAASTGLQLGRFISALLVSLLIAGGSVVASDSLAGEKERGTLETLLTTAVSRVEIVVAKQLSILLVALGMTAIQLIAIWIYIGSGLIDLPAGVDLHLTPGLAALLFLLYLPVAALIASVLLIASAYSKSYKEAQLYFLPAFVLGIAPTLAAMIPGATLRSALILVPIANISMAVKDILAGTPDPLMTVVAWLITAGAAGALAAMSSRLLSKESLLTSVQSEPSDALGGLEPFRRDVLRWVAAAWALVLVGSLFLGTGENILERQLAFNMTILLGLTFFLLRRYRLSARETLSLRLPPVTAWLAVLLGAPSALVVGQILFRATSRFLPVPEEALREFAEHDPSRRTPAWKLALLLVVTPAIVEELFFRGIVLTGLSGKRAAGGRAGQRDRIRRLPRVVLPPASHRVPRRAARAGHALERIDLPGDALARRQQRPRGVRLRRRRDPSRLGLGGGAADAGDRALSAAMVVSTATDATPKPIGRAPTAVDGVDRSAPRRALGVGGGRDPVSRHLPLSARCRKRPCASSRSSSFRPTRRRGSSPCCWW